MEKLIKSLNGQWSLQKAAPKISGHSVFTMDHVNDVAKMTDHSKAKQHVHNIVDASNAKEQNKKSIKSMIDKSRGVRDLVMGMSNHILAHPSEGLKVVKKELEKAAPSGVNDDSSMMFSQMEAIVHHIEEIRESIEPSENMPDWVDSKVTEAAKNMSDIAHYIMGIKQQKKL